MQILNSLKVGGKIHYAPSLEFIEQYLSLTTYEVNRINAFNNEFKTTVILRLK